MFFNYSLLITILNFHTLRREMLKGQACLCNYLCLFLIKNYIKAININVRYSQIYKGYMLVQLNVHCPAEISYVDKNAEIWGIMHFSELKKRRPVKYTFNLGYFKLR